MSEASKMFFFVMGFSTLIGGLIWLVALWDQMANHNPTAVGPLVGIPLGLVVWSPVAWWASVYFSRGK